MGTPCPIHGSYLWKSLIVTSKGCQPAEGELTLASPDRSWKWSSSATAPGDKVYFSHMRTSAWQVDLKVTGTSLGLTHWWVTWGSPSDYLDPAAKAKSQREVAAWPGYCHLTLLCLGRSQILEEGRRLNGFRFLPEWRSSLPLAVHSSLVQNFNECRNVTCKQKATGSSMLVP